MSSKVLALKISLTVVVVAMLVGMLFLTGNNPGLVGFERILVGAASIWGALTASSLIWFRQILSLLEGLVKP